MSRSDQSDKGPGQLPDAQHVESNPGADVMQVLENDGLTAKVVHADGTIDYIDAQAIGGDLETMPRGYFRSPQFIGTVVVCISFVFFFFFFFTRFLSSHDPSF